MDGFANRIAATQTLAKVLGVHGYTDPVALPLPLAVIALGCSQRMGVYRKCPAISHLSTLETKTLSPDVRENLGPINAQKIPAVWFAQAAFALFRQIFAVAVLNARMRP